MIQMRVRGGGGDVFEEGGIPPAAGAPRRAHPRTVHEHHLMNNTAGGSLGPARPGSARLGWLLSRCYLWRRREEAARRL